jgi:hypothetical protein
MVDFAQTYFSYFLHAMTNVIICGDASLLKRSPYVSGIVLRAAAGTYLIHSKKFADVHHFSL